MSSPRPAGTANERSLFVLELKRLDDWPDVLDVGRFVLCIAADARGLDFEALQEFAARVLAQGAVYICAWGQESGRVETAFDLESMQMPLPTEDDVVMTTDHAGESLREAIWFSLAVAWPSDGFLPVRSWLGVTVGSPADHTAFHEALGAALTEIEADRSGA
jgi:hypothetical protein